MRRFGFLVFLGLLAGCHDQPTTITAPDPLFSNGPTGTVVVVSPSGDLTGVTDAVNIEGALHTVKVDGGTVSLAKGHFYVSRTIAVEGFQGVIEGAGMDETTIEAVRRSPADGDGFSLPEPEEWTFLLPEYWPGPVPSVLQFEYPAGFVGIRDLTFVVNDPNPADPYDHYWTTGPTTALSWFVTLLGGDFDTSTERVRFQGAPGGTNLIMAHFVILGPRGLGLLGQGDVLYRDIILENALWYGLGVERFRSSTITFEDSKISNVWNGVYAGAYTTSNPESSVRVSNVDLSGTVYGMWFSRIPSGLVVTRNRVTGTPATGRGIFLRLVDQATIEHNRFTGFQFPEWNRAAVFAWNSNHNTIAKNRFEDFAENTAAIRLLGTSNGNYILKNTTERAELPETTAPTLTLLQPWSCMKTPTRITSRRSCFRRALPCAT